jgi:hypothetical protein
LRGAVDRHDHEVEPGQNVGVCIELPDGETRGKGGPDEISLDHPYKSWRLLIEQWLPVVAEIRTDGIGTVEFQEGGESCRGESAVRPVKQLPFFVVCGVDAARATELAIVGRIEDKSERPRSHGYGPALEGITSKQDVEGLHRQCLRLRQWEQRAETRAKIGFSPLEDAGSRRGGNAVSQPAIKPS